MKNIQKEHIDLCYYDELPKCEVLNILKEYRKSFEFFEDFFEKTINFNLKLFAYSNPEDVGIAYGDNESCNGFAREPNEIHFVYNKKIKCTGNHELAHLLSYLYMGNTPFTFIREGFAEFTEDYWTNIIAGEKVAKSHYEWAKLYFETIKKFELKDIVFDSEKFYEAVDRDGCFYSYPIAGAFTKYLVLKYGKEKYLEFYKNCSKDKFIYEYGDYNKVLSEFEHWIVSVK